MKNDEVRRLSLALLERGVTYVSGTDPDLLARRKGFEPLTPRFEVWCSIQLSYRRPRQR
jgi:hypothetical protein